MRARAVTGTAAMVAAGALLAAAAPQVRDVRTGVGTATLSGLVVSDEASARPIARAIVTVTGDELPAGRSAITDDRGRFALRDLPAGRFLVRAVRRGWVPGAYGARRPGRPGTPVQLGPGGAFDATIRMARAAVITGVLRDERGSPLPGVRVFALDARAPQAPDPTTRRGGGVNPGANGIESDDRGVYRLFDLAPGEYVIAAVPETDVIGDIERPSAGDVDRALARLAARESGTVGIGPATAPGPAPPAPKSTLAAIFHPGTAVLANAARVRVASGEVRDGVDFIVPAVPVTTIEGVVVSPEGALPAVVEMSIQPASTVRFFALASANPQLAERPGPDGRFKYTTIVPGHYRVLARASASGFSPASPAAVAAGRGGAPAGALYAAEEFTVTGQPVTGVVLRLERAPRLTGRVVVDAPAGPAPDLAGARVTLLPWDARMGTVAGTRIGGTFAVTSVAAVAADGSFEMPAVAPGRYRVRAELPAAAAAGWRLASAVVGGRDALDSWLDVALGAGVDAVLTISDRRSELAGVLEAAGGVPAPDYFVIVLPADPALRVEASRRVRTARPGTDGRFTFLDLPPGDYLLVALTDVEPDEWQQPDFLHEIAPAGVAVTVPAGGRVERRLRIGG